MARYAIEETTLTALGDAVRSKVGETRIENRYEEVVKTVELIYKGEALQNQKATNVIELTVPNAASVKIKLLEAGDGLDFIICFDNKGSFLGDITTSNLNEEIVYNLTDGYLKMYGMVINTAYSYNKAELTFLDNEGNIVQELITEEVLNTMTPMEMAGKINELVNVPNEAFVITGNCNNRFAYDGWNWFINEFKGKITTNKISNVMNMFYDSATLQEIPFEINLITNGIFNDLFSGAKKLEYAPMLNTTFTTHRDFGSIFAECYCLKEVPEWLGDMLEADYNITGANQNFQPWGSLFSSCYSLREIPEKVMEFLKNKNLTSYYYGLAYSAPFKNCHCLDELININCDDFAYTSNQFSSFFTGLSRVKDITFKTNEDNSPMIRNWKTITLDLSYVGYNTNKTYFIGYNSGITADKEVSDEISYQNLKNDPDWFTAKADYSRYNHDSAVNTINSLPDVSSSGGTNTIKFRGASGTKTDGGAINTLTEEEIAVAAAKGWTVSLV